jgi:hypothetical protein
MHVQLDSPTRQARSHSILAARQLDRFLGGTVVRNPNDDYFRRLREDALVGTQAALALCRECDVPVPASLEAHSEVAAIGFSQGALVR